MDKKNFVIRKNEKIEFYLKEKNGAIMLMAVDKEYKQYHWSILGITKKGTLHLTKSIRPYLGLVLDKEGRIIVKNLD